MESPLKKVILLLLVVLLWAGQSFCASAEPYYRYIRSKNPKLSPAEIGMFIAANKKYSEKYDISMYWHICKTGHESKFKSSVGNPFSIGGRRYDNEPCYGPERLQIESIRDMFPNLTEEQIKYRLLHNISFSVEASYRLDYANKRHALKMGYTTPYQIRVVSLLLYNCGIGSWKRKHASMAKYLRAGGKLEDLTVLKWSKLGFILNEVYSMNYYVNILRESDRLDAVFAAVEAESAGAK
jgi:hypothetical protein